MKNKVVSVLITIVLGGIFGWRYLTQTDRVLHFVEKEAYTEVDVSRLYKNDPLFTFKDTCSRENSHLFVFSGKKGNTLYKGEVCCDDIVGIFETCYFLEQKKVNSSK